MAVVHLATETKNSMLAALANAIDAGSAGGTIKLYTATIPADASVAISTQTLLGTLTFSDPCGSTGAGTLTMSSITNDTTADATGTATWARIADSSGTTIMDIDVSATGGSGALQLNTTAIVQNGPISITAFTVTL